MKIKLKIGSFESQRSDISCTSFPEKRRIPSRDPHSSHICLGDDDDVAASAFRLESCLPDEQASSFFKGDTFIISTSRFGCLFTALPSICNAQKNVIVACRP